MNSLHSSGMRQSVLIIFLLLALHPLARASDAIAPADTIPSDLPIPAVTSSAAALDGYIFAAVPYWGTGGTYLVLYNNQGKPVFFRRTPGLATDFKLHPNGLLTYFDGKSGKFFALDSNFAVVDSFWAKNGYSTDEHEIKFLKNGNVVLIGYGTRFYDMSQIIAGGDRNASVIVNVVQELDRSKNVVFEWKAFECYKLTDVGPAVNLRDPAFLHSHLNSIGFDLDSNLVISSRTLEEITKVHRRTGDIMWRLGGKNNQFKFVNDSVGFSAQHSASILPNGNLLLFDNGVYHQPHYSRAVEYKLDTAARTATLVWSYRNSPDVASVFWGNAQRLENGNTIVSWGKSEIGATEVNAKGEKLFELKFPTDVFSYRIFRFRFRPNQVLLKADRMELPTLLGLDQNYPNPFNGTTVIRFRVPPPDGGGDPIGRSHDDALSAFVRLSVLDLLGREVAILLNEYRAPGEYRESFTPANLSSGTYFYRLQVGSQILSGKLIYLK